MALTPEEQELLDFALAALPEWFRSNDRVLEDAGMMAKMMGQARATIADWFSQTLITQADGPTSTTPDWLNQHARDRNTNRQDGETDDVLADRLRKISDALTRPALLAAAQAILDAEGVAGDVALVEMRRDRIFAGSFTARTGTGGVFATVSGSTRKFTPDVPFPLPVEVNYPRSGAQGNPQIVFSGSASAGNDGTFEVTGLDGDAVTYENASGVDETDATVSWSLEKRDVEGNVRDGFARAYAGRGYRVGGRWPAMVMLIFILPYGSTPATVAAVREMLRQKKAAGFRALVERRLNP